MGLFTSKTPQERMRENKRMLDRSIRELDRERVALDNQVKKTMAEMKKMAKAGQEVIKQRRWNPYRCRRTWYESWPKTLSNCVAR